MVHNYDNDMTIMTRMITATMKKMVTMDVAMLMMLMRVAVLVLCELS